ncbi:MAG: cupin domain-containing protein [Patescibacteria group bacterium]|nr:cupin domain-containing protein [Patescibacteria group bacterium]
MQEFKVFQEERPWGNFRQFTHNTLSTVKILTLKPNQALSLQSHAKRSEFCRIISGSGIIEIGDNKYNVKEGDEYNIPINTKHRVSAGALGVSYLEISIGDFEENDEVRYEDQYGRA